MSTTRRIVPGALQAPRVMGDPNDKGPGRQVRVLAAAEGEHKKLAVSTDPDEPTTLLNPDAMRASALVLPDPAGAAGTYVRVGTEATDPDQWTPIAVGQPYTHTNGGPLLAYATAAIDVYTVDERH